jgi:hypothetical protein
VLEHLHEQVLGARVPSRWQTTRRSQAVHLQFHGEGPGSRHSLRAPMTPAGDASSNTGETLQSRRGGLVIGEDAPQLPSSVDDLSGFVGPEPTGPYIYWAHFGPYISFVTVTHSCLQNGTPRGDGHWSIQCSGS